MTRQITSARSTERTSKKFTREDLPDGKVLFRYDNVLSWLYEFNEL